MNKNSVICCFIAEHPDNWEQLLVDEYNLKIRHDGDYAMFNYYFNCDFSQPIVQEARGIIIDVVRMEVVSWPFRKFGNHNESYADKIDWSSARVLEKVDGSIIKLWYDEKKKGWQFSTNATIRAESAPVEEFIGKTFMDVILEADNYADIPFDRLDKSTTYIFELVSPYTRVVIDYGKSSLYHLGTRNNITGAESEVDIGIKKPKAYDIGSLDGCISAARALNGGDEVDQEGFVVVDAAWRRVKVKSPDYIMMNHLKQTNEVSKYNCLALLVEGKQREIEIICDSNPHLLPVFKYYDYRLCELKYQADRIGQLARYLKKEYGEDRAAIAQIIKKHKLSDVGFRALSDESNGSEIFMRQSLEKIIKLIPDYESDDIDKLFE